MTIAQTSAINKTNSIFQRILSLFKSQKKDDSVQAVLPYDTLFKDGICKSGRKYTKTIQYYDITYQLAKAEDKEKILESWCGFLNYFDSSVFFQLTFLNQTSLENEFEKAIQIPDRQDGFDRIRKEYGDMLKEQLAKGNNGISKTKYITFGIEADTYKVAKSRLERMETDILSNFKKLGVRAYGLNGKERLSLLHDCLHENDSQRFSFQWEDIVNTGLSTKDMIAPNSFVFSKSGKTFKIGDRWAAASFLNITAADIFDEFLMKLLDLDDSLIINFHIQTLDQIQAIKQIKRIITDIEAMIIDEQKKAVRSGYDYDHIPNNLVLYSEEAKKLLEKLQNHDERLFLVTVLLTHTAKTREQLENNIFQTASVIQQKNCILRRLDYQQEQGFQSSLPLGMNQIPIQRALTSSATAIFVPFTTSELFQSTGEALYYGTNAISNNLIMADRKLLTSPNGLILGSTGSGKSFAAKREILNIFLCTQDDIIILDAEGEYLALVQALGGQVIEISPNSKSYINPFDINANYNEDDDPIVLKSDFLLTLCEQILSSNRDLELEEISIIDRCLKYIYERYFLNPIPENIPRLSNLYDSLIAQNLPIADRIANALEYYVQGTMNVFNHQTNINIHNRVVCFNTKNLGNNLKKIGMYIIQDAIWNRVSANRQQRKKTRIIIDEFHLLLKDKQTAGFSVEIWKRFRKWGGILTGITQDVTDLLKSPEIGNIFENTGFYYLLKQGPADREILSKKLNISENQLSYITDVDAGEGLLIYGNTIIPFKDHFPKDTLLYQIMTTKPDEMEGLNL